jgi:hypothetical protein
MSAISLFYPKNHHTIFRGDNVKDRRPKVQAAPQAFRTDHPECQSPADGCQKDPELRVAYERYEHCSSEGRSDDLTRHHARRARQRLLHSLDLGR